MIRHYTRPSQQTPAQLATPPAGFGSSIYTTWRQDAVDIVEEIIAAVALAKNFANDPDIKKLLDLVQRKLMTISFGLENKITPQAGQYLAGINPADVEGLANCVIYFNHQLPFNTRRPITGQNKAGAMLALASMLARRGARKIQPITDMEEGGEITLKFIQQLAKLLEVLERVEYQQSNIPEKFWT